VIKVAVAWHDPCCIARVRHASTFALSLVLLAAGCADDPQRGAWGGHLDGAADDGGGDGFDDALGDTGGGVDPTGHADDDHGDGRPDDGGYDDGGSSGGGGDDNGSADGGGDDGGPPPAHCPDNCYCEPIDAMADVSDFANGYAGDWEGAMLGVLQRRWPAGHDLLVEQQDDPYFGAFTDTSSFAGVMDSLMTEVHEGTHGWDWNHALGQPYFGYWLRSDLIFEPPKIDGFARAEILGMVEGSGTSLYDGTYLTGTQGTYGWYELVDEMNCYINGMAAIGVVGEYIPWGTSGRDGAYAFMYYTELYLRRARTQYPSLYAELRADPEWVELIKIQWLRLHFLAQEAADLHPDLGIHDDEIEVYMYAPANQAEIEMFIDHPLQASNCLP
jgi:hypothetical protein